MFADRRRWAIGGAVVVGLALAWWTLRSPSPAASTVAAQSRPRAGRVAVPAAVEPLRPVKLDLLASSAGREEPSDTARNPFRFQARAATQPRSAAPVERPEVQRPPTPMPPGGPPPSVPIPLKFIGVVERANGVKWAVLSDGRVTLHGRDGDIIDGRYKILKIGVESIELAYVDGHGRQTVRLTGQ